MNGQGTAVRHVPDDADAVARAAAAWISAGGCAPGLRSASLLQCCLRRFMNTARIARLRRYLHPSAWKLLATIGTDPSLDRLFEQKQRSFDQKLADPLPWWAFDAIDFLAAELKPGSKVFEWGSGFSTLWLTAKEHRVLSLEHDQQWYETIRDKLAGTGSEVRFTPLDDDYPNPALSLVDYDMIIIDGRRRADCCRTVMRQADAGAIKPGAFLLFDDAHRKSYFPVIRELMPYVQAHYAFSDPCGVVMQEITSVFVMK